MYAVRVFVTLEGPKGAGKSSVMRGLAHLLESDDIKVLTTREPGDGSLGPRVRQILLEGGALDPKAELLLFLADRAQHVAEVIRPSLARGEIVLCDRYVDSTLAYQGYGRDLEVNRLREWNDFATGGLVPDLTLLLDIEPSKGLQRVKDKNRLDSEPLQFHQKVREGFLKEAERDRRRWVILDASENLENVTHAALEAVKQRRALKL